MQGSDEMDDDFYNDDVDFSFPDEQQVLIRLGFAKKKDSEEQ